VVALLLAIGFGIQIVQPQVIADLRAEAVMRPRFGVDTTWPNIPAYPEINERSIFTPGRALGASAPAADGAPKLVGIAALGANVSTVLRTSDGVDHVVEVGENLAGWRLVAANEAQAVLGKGDKRVTQTLGDGDSDQPASSRPSNTTVHPARIVRAGGTR